MPNATERTRRTDRILKLNLADCQIEIMKKNNPQVNCINVNFRLFSKNFEKDLIDSGKINQRRICKEKDVFGI